MANARSWKKVVAGATLGMTAALASGNISAADCDANACTCTGKINGLLQYADSDGTVRATGTVLGNYKTMCKLKAPWGNISTTLCAVWLSMLKDAKLSDKSAVVYYSFPAGTNPYNGQNCTALPNYGQSLQPLYVGLLWFEE